ncbi:MAG: hypothetical protein MI922_03990, partial [Bacteroidales bacterium]|nr:hypothetical protein [Bacteroidales bacterium]
MKATHPHLVYHSLDSLFDNPKEVLLIALFNSTNSYSAYFEVDEQQYKVNTKIDTSNGLIQFDKKTVTDIRLPSDRYNTHESADSSKWISHQGPFSDLVKISKNKISKYDFSQVFGGNNIITQIVETSDGNILAGGVGCIFSIKNGTLKKYTKPEVPLSSDLKVILYKDSKENIWVINQMAQVYMLEYHNNHWQTFPDLSFQMETDDGNKWFISKNNKIVKQESSGKNDGKQWYYFDSGDGLMSHPLGVIQTRRGDTWCSGNHHGKAATAYLENNKWHMQIHDFAWSIDGPKMYEASNGSIWFSSYKDLLYRGPGVLELNYNHLDSLSWKQWKRPIFASGGFAEFNDTLWGASTMGLFKINNKTGFGSNISLLSEVDAIQTDQSGNLWAGTRKNGIVMIKKDGTRTHFKSPQSLVSNIVIDLQLANDTALWVVTEKDFSYFDGKDWINNCLPEQLLFNLEGGKLNLTDNETIWISKFDKKWSRQMYRNNPKDKYSGEFYSVRYR